MSVLNQKTINKNIKFGNENASRNEVEDATTGDDQATAFVFNGNTYVYIEHNGSTDTLVQLTGLVATGLDTLANSGTIAGDGYVVIG